MTAAQKLTAEFTAESYARGKAEGKAELLLRQLGLRFGPLPQHAIEKVFHATPDQLDVWAERVITVQRLDDILS